MERLGDDRGRLMSEYNVTFEKYQHFTIDVDYCHDLAKVGCLVEFH